MPHPHVWFESRQLRHDEGRGAAMRTPDRPNPPCRSGTAFPLLLQYSPYLITQNLVSRGRKLPRQFVARHSSPPDLHNVVLWRKKKHMYCTVCTMWLTMSRDPYCPTYSHSPPPSQPSTSTLKFPIWQWRAWMLWSVYVLADNRGWDWPSVRIQREVKKLKGGENEEHSKRWVDIYTCWTNSLLWRREHST